MTRDGSLTRFGVEKSKGLEIKAERARRDPSQENEELIDSKQLNYPLQRTLTTDDEEESIAFCFDR